jgi:hypothetical protein
LASGATTADNLLERGYDEMYNLHFDQAHQTFAEFHHDHPADARGPASDAAAYLFSELARLHILQSEFFTNDTSFLNFRREPADPEIKRKFEAALTEAEKLAQATLAKSPSDPDALFALTLRHGLEADFLALVEKRNLAALSEVKIGRETAQKLLALRPDYYDAYLAAGVENYLLSLKPAPLRWVLNLSGAQTDKETGIKNLRVVAEKGHYLAPYAKLLLAIASLRDNDRARARTLLNELSHRYPGNPLYQEELGKIK